jgi:hypothetical protein
MGTYIYRDSYMSTWENTLGSDSHYLGSYIYRNSNIMDTWD